MKKLGDECDPSDYANDDPNDTPYNRWMKAAVNEFQIAIIEGTAGHTEIIRLHLYRACNNLMKVVEEVARSVDRDLHMWRERPKFDDDKT